MVCTGNTCRSPMAEAILRVRLRERDAEIRVSSAGIDAWAGSATENSILAMSEFGLDLSSHRSRKVTPEIIAGSDLILAMTRNHFDRITRLCPDAFNRTFMPSEMIRLASRPRESSESVRAWAALLSATRPDGPIGRGADEVGDPVGEEMEAYRLTARRLNAEMTALADLLVPISDTPLRQ